MNAIDTSTKQTQRQPGDNLQTPTIQIKGLNFHYSDGHPALQDINLEIHQGDVFGIIGHTGAGKSTLLQHLNGILAGQQGEVLIDGVKIEKQTIPSIREKVGIVFQNPDDQLFCPTVFEDIAFGLVNLGYPPQEILQKVDEILARMNLSHLRDLSSHHLSFGEKKRVAFATTLVMNPQVLALDEPFANLDYKSILTITDIIKELPLTRVIISQDILLAMSICDRIAIMDHGKIVKIASPGEIASQPHTLRSVGLDYTPYLELIKKFI